MKSLLSAATRRAWLHGMLCAAAAGATPAAVAADAVLPAPQSLADALAVALRGHQPLVVLVSLAGCPFCQTVRNNYLAPLQRTQGLAVVQLDMRSQARVRDFQQADTTHDALVRAWNVQVAPTVLFFGAQGQELAPRLKGASIPDFYGAYLDQRLEEAQQRLRAPIGTNPPL